VTQITFEVPSLDCQWPDELRELGASLEMLANYCRIKAAAMSHREAGRLDIALRLESWCDRIYSQLPEWARW
jgi:hypothetical protein